jgi:hypothetical protein
MKRLILAAALITFALPAAAQQKKIGGVVGHVLDDIQAPEKPVTNAPCDFNIFTALQAKNLLDQLKICATTRGQDDLQLALDSATKSNDKVGVSCLQPALAIVQAAAQASIAQSAAHGDTAPAVPDPNSTTPAAHTPVPGLVTMFQKFREFVLAGGVTACKSYVNVTIVAGQPIGQ